jgi:cytochrome c biogenesis protein ResB
MGFIIALLVVIAVLAVCGALLYLIDKDADVSDSA